MISVTFRCWCIHKTEICEIIHLYPNLFWRHRLLYSLTNFILSDIYISRPTKSDWGYTLLSGSGFPTSIAFSDSFWWIWYFRQHSTLSMAQCNWHNLVITLFSASIAYEEIEISRAEKQHLHVCQFTIVDRNIKSLQKKYKLHVYYFQSVSYWYECSFMTNERKM